MKSFIIAALLFSVSASAQDYSFSKTEFDSIMAVQASTFGIGSNPVSVDGLLISHVNPDRTWYDKYPDGYDIYCDPCEIKYNDWGAKEQGFVIPHNVGTAISISMPHWLADTIVIKIDTIKCAMLISELGGPAKHQNGYGVIKGRSHLKYLDANKAEVKGFVWMSQYFEW